ncbi:MAG: hypothetical protein J5641_02670 [Bacteroidales bacterium]|nr:hypothetical protein [Bacteroidales bacterium]
MNNTFEWTRFRKVVHKDFSNIWQNAGTSLLIITLLPIAAWLLWWALSGVEEMPPIAPEVRWCFIAGAVFLAAMVSPSRMYRTCNLQKEGIYFAMLPASKLEKYLSMLLFTIVVCPLLCLVGGIVLDYFLTLLPFGPYTKWLWQTDYLAEVMDSYRALASGSVPNADESIVLLTQVFTPSKGVLYGLVSYLSTVGMFLFTTTIFKKHKVLQTILWTWLISFVINLVLTPIMGVMMLSGNWMMDFLESADPVRSFNTAYWVAMAWGIVLTVVFFWWASYRLKHMKY